MPKVSLEDIEDNSVDNDVINNNELFFSSDIANKILSTIEKEEDYTITRHMSNNNIDLNNNVLEYTKSESEEYNF